MASLKGIVAFVSGGASGLGKATMMHLLRQGAKGVYSYDMQAFKTTETVDLDKLMWTRGDVRDEDQVKKALKECYEKFGRIDALVTCAGVSISFFTYNSKKGRVHHLRDFADVMAVNLTGTFNVIRLGVGYLAKNELSDKNNPLRGTIITTSGLSSFDGQLGQTAYSCSAGAIEALTAPLAKDFAVQGIRCVNICPGYFNTPIFSRSGKDFLQYFENYAVCPRRMGKDEDYAKLVESILTNPFINATSITVNGAMMPYVFPFLH